MSPTNVLDKLMETMMMQMFNKDCAPTCHNRTCNSQIYHKSRKKKKRRTHCKKKLSKCPAEGVASIVCVTKCMKKCRKTGNDKCSDPSRAKTKSRCVRITCCSNTESDCSSSEPKYCSKCGQPSPGSTVGDTIVSPENSPNLRRLNQEIDSNKHVKTCYPAQTTCTPCQNIPFQSHKTMVGCVRNCDYFGPPYFVKNDKPEDSHGNTIGIRLNDVQKQNERMVQVACCESNSTVNASSADLKNVLPPNNVKRRNCPATVHIKKWGKNIVTVRCGVDSDFDLESDNDGRTQSREQIGGVDCEPSRRQSQKVQCSQRFIHITEDQRSDNEGNCATKVRCADYSSITSGPRHSLNRYAPIKPDLAKKIGNLRYGPCGDHISSAGLPNSTHNIAYGSCSDGVSSAAHPIKSNLFVGYGPCSERKKPALHINSTGGCNEQPQVVRMRFIKPCDNKVESPDHDLACVPQPSGTCCISCIPGPPVFCYDPCTYQYKDDESYYCIDEPQEPPISQPPPPIYEKSYEFLSEQNRPPSESPSLSSSSPDHSQIPQGRYGYDFFYGSLKPK